MATAKAMLPDALDLDPLEARFRARRVRHHLYGQTLGERIAQARARYGRVYTRAELRAVAYPRRRAWSSRIERRLVKPLEAYRAPIPDDALLRYDDASETALFSRFCVVAPAGGHEDRPTHWIVGELRGGLERYAIVARWHTQTGRTRPRRIPHPKTREGETS